MSTETQVEAETEQDWIERWRSAELERAGYAPGAAAELASAREVDLHLAVALIERGCSHELALRILL